MRYTKTFNLTGAEIDEALVDFVKKKTGEVFEEVTIICRVVVSPGGDYSSDSWSASVAVNFASEK